MCIANAQAEADIFEIQKRKWQLADSQKEIDRLLAENAEVDRLRGSVDQLTREKS